MKRLGGDQVTDPILEALSAYFDACPMLAGGACTAAKNPCTALPGDRGNPETGWSAVTSAGCLRQSTYVLDTDEQATAQARQVLRGKLCRDLAAWIRQQTRGRRLPRLPAGMTTQSLAAEVPGPLAHTGGQAGTLAFYAGSFIFKLSRRM